MAVQQNPFERWITVRENSDYRSKETQASSLTRQMLSQPEYLRNTNRVNPGPYRNLRARDADIAGQTPHITGNEDIWGWQRWTEGSEYLAVSEVSSSLREPANPEEIPGVSATISITYSTYPLPDEYVPLPVPTPGGTSYAGGINYVRQTPAFEWVITHNLGYFPSVSMVNESGEVVDASVTHPSVNVTVITFNRPVSGSARLV